MKEVSYKLNKNSWYHKMNLFVYGDDYMQYNFCPYFWLSILAFFAFPFATIVRGIIATNNWIAKSKAKTAKQKMDDYAKPILELEYQGFVDYLSNKSFRIQLLKNINKADTDASYIHGIRLDYVNIRSFIKHWVGIKYNANPDFIDNIPDWKQPYESMHDSNKIYFLAEHIMSKIYGYDNYYLQYDTIAKDSIFSGFIDKFVAPLFRSIDNFFEKSKSKISKTHNLVAISQVITGAFIGTAIAFTLYGLWFILPKESGDIFYLIGLLLACSGISLITYGLIVGVKLLVEKLGGVFLEIFKIIAIPFIFIFSILSLPFVFTYKFFRFLLTNYCPGIDWDSED